jgi:hypothetical protein
MRFGVPSPWRSPFRLPEPTSTSLGFALTRSPFLLHHAPGKLDSRIQLREALPAVFKDRRQKPDRSAEELQAQLYQQIDQLKVELDWLKKVGLER